MLAQLTNVSLCDGKQLRPYWQRTPVLLTQALDPTPLIPSTETLLEILNDTALPARLITGDMAEGFTLSHGPFEGFRPPSSGAWTVLIQALDQLFPEYDALRTAMAWLPAWRFEDVMLSWASPGGSVGAHYDHFSVFLVQLSGRRQWAVGPQANQNTPLVPNQPLRLVDLAADDHVVASPGDVLYLPPGVIHHGVAMDPDCMTLSIGFRAPDAGALFETLVEQLDDSETWFRFDDPDRDTEGPSAAITAEDLVRTRAQLLNFLDRPGVLERILATRVTEPYLHEDPDVSDDEIDLQSVNQWRIEAGTRMAYTETGFAIQGIWCDEPPSASLRQLADTREITGIETMHLSPTERHGLIAWVQAGWVVDADLD
jgi:50S ribosomal protein L16 3-hydroxylase